MVINPSQLPAHCTFKMLLVTSAFLLVFAPHVTGQDFECTRAKNSECYRHMPRVSYDQRCKNDSVMSAMVVINLLVLRGAFVLFMCGRVGRQEHCQKSDYLNQYGEQFRFHCPEGAVITAVEYQYSEAEEDGLFRITCCKVKGKRATNCSPWKESGGFKQYVRVSHMDDSADHTIPAVAGLLSKPATRQGVDYHYKTREFIVMICNLE